MIGAASGARRILAGAAITTLFAVAFSGVPRCGWVNWDDPLHVLDNPLLEAGSRAGAAAIWQAGYRGLYIPVSYCLFGTEAQAARWLAGAEPGSRPDALLFHVVSLVLHAVCVALAWRLLLTLSGDRAAAIAGAGLFAVHPLQVESVAWISEQRGLLAAALGLLAIERWTPLWTRGMAPSRWNAIGGTLALAAALLAKPSAMAVPAIVTVLAVFHGGVPSRRIGRMLAPWIALALGCAALTKALQSSTGQEAPWLPLRLVVAGDAVAFYTSKLFLPLDLCIDYGRTPTVVLDDPFAWCRAAACAGAIGAVFLVPACRPARLAAALWLVPLVPILGLVPFAFQEISTVADRYTYLAMLGPAAGVTAFLAGRTAPGLLAATWTGLAFLALVAARQTMTWHDSLALNLNALRVNGGTRDTANNLGLACLEDGHREEAILRFRQSIDRDPRYPRSRFNLGLAYHELGRDAEAERCYAAALAIDPCYTAAHNNFGILLASQGRLAAAAEHFRAAARGPEGREAALNLRRLESLAPPQNRSLR
jgi:protein O-mannosyl-transferase